MSLMQPQPFQRKLPSALAAAVLLTVSGTALAEPVSLTLQYTCPLPLVGNQPIIAKISSDIPNEITAGETTPAFQILADTTVNDNSRLGLTLVGATTIEGTANSSNSVSTASGDQLLDVLLTIPQSPIPTASGPFTVPATGIAPALTFSNDDLGQGTIRVGGLTLNMTARTASGAIAPAPVGQFTAVCTQDAGQENILQTFQVVASTPNPVPDISIDPASVAFGSVQAGLSATQSLTIANKGGAALGINGISLAGADADAFMQTNNCTSVAAGASCNVSITYFPSGDGAQVATLTINSGDADQPTIDVPVTGTSVPVPVPVISVTPAQMDFGTLQMGASVQKVVTISNTGLASLTINSVSISGANSSDYVQTNNCTTVAPNASCAATVTFTAAAAGTSSALLTVASDDATSPTVQIALNAQVDEPSSGGGVDLALDLKGATHIKASNSNLPLTGSIAANLELATGIVNADLQLNPTSGQFAVIQGFSKLKATAQVQFEQTDLTRGSLINGVLKTDSQMFIKVPKVTVKLFGFNLPIGGGSQCKTIDPVNISLQTPNGQTFAPLGGGTVAGVYALPPLTQCGALTSILNLFLAGPGNTISVDLTPILP